MDSTTTSRSYADHVDALRARVDEALLPVVTDRASDILCKPIEHILRSGGKRVRPTILLLVAAAYGAAEEQALPAALAVEVFHNFTLVHDDIMDESAERRGQPTVHVEWDSGTALLAGDLMLGLSFDLLSQVEDTELAPLYGVFNPMVEQLCAGQALDAALEDEREVPLDAYLDMIDRKTGALLSASFEMGGVIGKASSADQEHLRAAGRLVGRAFQIQDDLLDLTADDDEWGKAVGGDLVAGKKTFLTLRALEVADGDEYDWFLRLVTEGGLPPEDVSEARERMARLGVFQDARDAVTAYTDRARDELHVLPDAPATDTLHWFLDQMEDRQY